MSTFVSACVNFFFVEANRCHFAKYKRANTMIDTHEDPLKIAMLENENLKRKLRVTRTELRFSRRETEEASDQLDKVSKYYDEMLKQRDNLLAKLHASEKAKRTLNHTIICLKKTRTSKDAVIFELKHKNAALYRSERKFKAQVQKLEKSLHDIFDVSDISTSEFSSSDSPPELEVVCAKTQEKPEKTALSAQSDDEQPCSPKRKDNRPSASESKQKGTPARPKKRARKRARSSRLTKSSSKRTRK